MGDKEFLTEKVADLLEDKEKTIDAILEATEEQLGDVPFVMEVLSDRPDSFIPEAISDYLKTRPDSLDSKTAELVALAAAAANKCPPCIRMHVNAAKKCGAEDDEILDTLLISGVMGESAVLAKALRVYEEEKS